MDHLIHVIYSSTAIGQLSEPELAELLRVSRWNNEQAGITGMLLAVDGTYFQVLEGPESAVDEFFARIGSDPRHSRIVSIIRERIFARSFSAWSMGLLTATPEEVMRTADLNDFFDAASCVEQIDGGRAKKLLFAFRSGRWRARLDTPRSQAFVAPRAMANG